jgi:Alpha galactosidase C-terminal beta sandwich domain
MRTSSKSIAIQGHIVRSDDKVEIGAGKPLFDGTQAVLVFNRGTAPAEVRVSWAEMGLVDPVALYVRNLWGHQTTGPQAASLSPWLPKTWLCFASPRPTPSQSRLTLSPIPTGISPRGWPEYAEAPRNGHCLEQRKRRIAALESAAGAAVLVVCGRDQGWQSPNVHQHSIHSGAEKRTLPRSCRSRQHRTHLGQTDVGALLRRRLGNHGPRIARSAMRQVLCP